MHVACGAHVCRWARCRGQAGAFRIGDTAGTLDNIVACKLHRPGSVGFVSKSGGMSNEMYNVLARTTDGLYEGAPMPAIVSCLTLMVQRCAREARVMRWSAMRTSDALTEAPTWPFSPCLNEKSRQRVLLVGTVRSRLLTWRTAPHMMLTCADVLHASLWFCTCSTLYIIYICTYSAYEIQL